MSWEQLISILDRVQYERDAERSGPPVACPNDGEPLSVGPNGELFCKFDGWRYE